MSIYLHQPAVRLSVSLDMLLLQSQTVQQQQGPALSFWVEQALQAGADQLHCSIGSDNATDRLALLSALPPHLLSALECQLDDLPEQGAALAQLAMAAHSLSVERWRQYPASEPPAQSAVLRLGLTQLQQLSADQFGSQCQGRLLQLQLMQSDLGQAGGMAGLMACLASAAPAWRAAGWVIGIAGDLKLESLQQLLGQFDVAVLYLDRQLLAQSWQHGWSRAIGMARAALRHTGVAP